MELSANRRYTSKLVLEDTTTVFQKTKEERSGKNKRIREGGRSQRKSDIIRMTLRSEKPWLTWGFVSGAPRPLQMSLRFMCNISPRAVLHCSACESPGEFSVLFGGSWIIHCSRGIDVAQEGQKNSRHGLEAEWRLWWNFNCTAGNAAISAIVIGKTPLHRLRWKKWQNPKQCPPWHQLYILKRPVHALWWQIHTNIYII